MIAGNIAALRSLRHLDRSSNSLTAIFERLASGQRINRASDDAAGLAIATSLNADARIYSQAVRNVNDGISVLSIADGALGELGEIITRLQELAEQSANGSFNFDQRQVMQAEADALVAEHNRIVSSTEFNGINLFDPNNGSLAIQAGRGLNAIISTDLAEELSRTVGDGSYVVNSTISSGSRIEGVAIGDLDGNGTQDIVVMDSHTGIELHLGNGDGTFQARQFLGADPTNGGYDSVELRDINDDGNLDIISTSDPDNQVQIILGNGDGTFQNEILIDTGAGPEDLTIADFNGDGILDIATADDSGPSISVLIGNGDGTFADAVSYAVTNNTVISTVKSGDFNGDGIVDLVGTGYASGQLTFLFGSGDGSFTEGATSYSITDQSQVDLTVGDINHDGLDDIIVAGQGAGPSLKLVISNGDGTFQEEEIVGPVGIGFRSIDAIDLNGDGFLDLAARNTVDDSVWSFLGNGDGTFSDGTSVSVGADSFGVGTLGYGDLDGDGAIDIVSGNRNDGTLSILIANTTEVTSLQAIRLFDEEDALSQISVLEAAKERIILERGAIGAAMSRLEVAENVLQVTQENYKAAESRILDADVAAEAAKLAKEQILQQIGAAILAQANQQPQLVLQLIRNEP